MIPPATDLSDAALLNRVHELARQSNEVTAALLQHLAVLEARKLYAATACSSLFTWCVAELGLSEDAAYKRITAARAAQRFPVLLERLAEGRLHLTGICLLAPHLDEANHLALITAAALGSGEASDMVAAVQFMSPEAGSSRFRRI